jgi:CheY-like chemotaxis protein
LRQILLNLSGNAVKFTPTGEVVIRACLDREDEYSAVIRFSVEDAGIGVSSDRQAHIFSPFTQGDDSTTRKYGGTGLGLAISRQLVTLLGGHIGVESEPGKGSKFWFTAVFEKTPGELRADLPNVKEETSGRDFLAPMRRARILVAEDNIVNQKVALSILKKLGHHADAVANGKEALAALRSITYDLVLMDCQMPEMDGYEAAASIRDPRSGARNPQIPIIALTASAMKGDRDKCLQMGMNDYIAKPVKSTTVAAALEKWLPRKVSE